MEFVGLAASAVSNITATRSVALVIKSGRVVYTEDPAASSPPGI